MANTKIPVELSSTPGIVDNSDATAITIDSSENVGIGSTSPDSHLHLESSGATSFRIRTTASSSEPQMIMIDGAGDYFSMQKVDRGMTFKPQGAEEVRIDADGLKFNGDTAAANALDDYEEGEWTPAVSGGTSAGTTTHTHQNGQYVKVGELVSVTCFVRYTAATGSGYLKLTGLPYAIGNRTQNYPVAATIVDGLNWGGGTYLQALSVPGLQETNFYYMIDDANAGRQDLTNETVSIRFTMTYRI